VHTNDGGKFHSKKVGGDDDLDRVLCVVLRWSWCLLMRCTVVAAVAEAWGDEARRRKDHANCSLYNQKMGWSREQRNHQS